MKKILIISLLLLQFVTCFATHNRAGEITYKQISDLTYKFTLITYTYTPSAANETRDYLEMQWGDNTTSMIPRILEVFLPDDYTRNEYEGEHTFPGPGTYKIVMEDPNRNYGVENIPNSVGVPFSISTILQINPVLGTNSTPELLYPPVDKAAVGHIFVHNPSAYDPDGDSLSYKLTTCTGAYGEYISGYTLPEASNTIYVDEITGDLVWDCPVYPGIYNVAMLIEEWRNGVKISMITRDIQIEVHETDNNSPEIPDFEDFCVVADSLLEFTVTATDADNDMITLTATGGPFEIENSPAEFPTASSTGSVSSVFSWQTNCTHVRKQFYHVAFKAHDNNYDLSLFDIKTASILVVAPEPEITSLEPTSNSIVISWTPSYCPQALGYNIYRRIGSYPGQFGHCVTGVPEEAGYQKVGETEGINDTTFLDNSNGEGLPQGHIYCYRITAWFPDGGESYASEEECTELVRGIPAITNVSVNFTGQNNGSMYVAWAKPDTITAEGPFRYLIYHSPDLWGNDLALIDSLDGADDTTYIDTMLNTLDNPYSYKIEFWNVDPNNRYLIGRPHIASSVYLNIFGADNQNIIQFDKNVPWLNDYYDVYRQNKTTLDFEFTGTTDTIIYIDDNLINDTIYCYKAISYGGYSTEGFIDPIINHSQENCGAPIDTIPSCPPGLTVISHCDSLRNELNWTNPNTTCADDVTGYNIYYSPLMGGDLEFITAIDNAEETTYLHYPDYTMAGCYAVTAIDSFLNESAFSIIVCIDSCIYYELPNVFTPNGDGHNDIFKPGPYYFVEKVEMQIFNRWGMPVYETEDPDINWDGRYMKNNKLVSSGVYYYICNVFEHRLTGLESRYLYGFIHVFTDEFSEKP